MPSATALALLYLRTFAGVTQKDLTGLLGGKDEKLLSRYETGGKDLSREQLDDLLAPLGIPPEAVDLLLFTHAQLAQMTAAGAPAESPLDLDREELRDIDRACLTAAWTVAASLRPALVRRKRQEKESAARREAAEQVDALLAAPGEERRDLVGIFPEFQGWAVAERLCEESERAGDAAEALELAELALAAAGREGDGRLRAAAEGYSWAYAGDARRAAGDLAGAEAAFVRARERQEEAAAAVRQPFAGWRPPDLEASLRWEQQRFPAALALLDQARRLAEPDDLAVGRLLLKRADVLVRTGDLGAALATLEEAAPRVEAAEDLRCRFALRFSTADVLCQLERHAEAAALLPEVQELAGRLEKGGLAFVRALWLGARIDAGQGRPEEAVRTLELVRREFAERRLAQDAALASLDLAVLLLEAGRAAEVRELALGMSWILTARRISREASAALALFCRAAGQESASAALARQVRAELQRIGNASAAWPAKPPKRRVETVSPLSRLDRCGSPRPVPRTGAAEDDPPRRGLRGSEPW